MNITKGLKYLLENLCMLVAFCMPTSLLAVETITMDPECVSLDNQTGNTGSASLVAKTNHVTFTLSEAEPGATYRLKSSDGNITLETTSDETVYTGSTDIYYDLKNFNNVKNADHVVKTYYLQKKDGNGNYRNVTDPATSNYIIFEVKNCWIECGSTSDNLSFVTTQEHTCYITLQELADELKQTGVTASKPLGLFPVAHNIESYDYCFTQGDGYNICLPSTTTFDVSKELTLRIWLKAGDDFLDVCTLKKSNNSAIRVNVKSCPEFSIPIIEASSNENGKCVALNEVVLDSLGTNNASYSKSFSICSDSQGNTTSTETASLTGWSTNNFEPGTYKAIWQFSGYTCPQTFKVVSPSLKCVAPADITLDVSSGCRQTTLTLPSLDGMCGDLSIYWRRQNQKDSTLVTSASSSYTTDFYPSDNPYVIIWTVTDGAVAKNCQSTVTVTKTGMSCPDLTIISDGGKVSIPLPAVPIGCGITRTVDDKHGLTESGDVLTGTLNPGSYSFSVTETPESGSASSCTFNVLVVEKADICK